MTLLVQIKINYVNLMKKFNCSLIYNYLDKGEICYIIMEDFLDKRKKVM